MTPRDLAARAQRIRLQQKRWAELASLDETTVERTLNEKTQPLLGTVTKLETVLVAEEIDLLRHLHGLHGCRLVEPIEPAALLAAPAAGEAVRVPA